MKHTPEPPRHLSVDAKAFWRSVCDDYQIGDQHGLRLLTLAAESMDLAEQAREQLAREGLTVLNSRGGMAAHPCVDARNRAVATFIRCITSLGLQPVDMGVK